MPNIHKYKTDSASRFLQWIILFYILLNFQATLEFLPNTSVIGLCTIWHLLIVRKHCLLMGVCSGFGFLFYFIMLRGWVGGVALICCHLQLFETLIGIIVLLCADNSHMSGSRNACSAQEPVCYTSKGLWEGLPNQC